MPLFWPTTVPISYESSKKVTPRILIAKFGDGYEQRTPDGINIMPRSGTIKVDQLRFADPKDPSTAQKNIQFLDNWLRQTQGVQAFFFTPPYDVQGTFVADQGWTITEKGYDYAILEVPIREVFELV
jgi:phage-related protein